MKPVSETGFIHGENMSVTVYDIAKRATVSVSTVSRVLNNNPVVKAERRGRVLAAMEELNYTPNQWARGMGKKSLERKTGQIALLLINIPDQMMHTAYMMQYIHGVQQEIAATGRKCTFVAWNEQTDEGEVPNVLLDGEVDGVVFKIIGGLHNETTRRWLNRYPRVALNHHPMPPDCDCVVVDYETGIYQSVRYLADRGHRRIAYVNLKTSSKLKGYRDAVKQLGLDVDEDMIQVRSIDIPLKSESELDWAIDNLWSLSKPPTAILSNDFFCSAIYHALSNRGLKVPDDVSIIGYDNETVLCESLAPKLTSIDIGAVDLGKIAVKRVLERIKKPQERYQKTFIQGQIVERASVKDRTTGNRE